MTIPLVMQLRFARSEFQRCLEGVSADDAVRQIDPMNSISWYIGHLAVQENFYWNTIGQGKTLYPKLHELVGYGKAGSVPPLNEMWEAWHEITTEADIFLDQMHPDSLVETIQFDDKQSRETAGTMLLRNIYHYWFHTGEAHAVRQTLGHKDLPDFVGDMSAANYTPES